MGPSRLLTLLPLLLVALALPLVRAQLLSAGDAGAVLDFWRALSGDQRRYFGLDVCPSDLTACTVSPRVFGCEEVGEELRIVSVVFPTPYEGLAFPNQTAVEALARLSALQTVRISGFAGLTSFPTEFAQLKDLRVLDLSGNGLQGTIPPQYGATTSLQVLSLENNRLTSLFTSVGLLTNLQSLSLSANALAGALPSELWSAKALTSLSLDHNSLTGTVPTQLALLSGLVHVALDGNLLTGPLPAQLPATLATLGLGDNHLGGAIPASWSSLTSLSLVRLSNCALTGAVPTFLGAMPLTYLLLGGNALSGPLPAQLPPSLVQLDLRGNNLTGTVPSGWASLGALAFLDLSLNSVSGSIPAFLGSLPLRSLRLGGNRLTGRLPAELAPLFQTPGGEIDLQNNQLIGSLHAAFASSSVLRTLQLAGNPLSCPRPNYSAWAALESDHGVLAASPCPVLYSISYTTAGLVLASGSPSAGDPSGGVEVQLVGPEGQTQWHPLQGPVGSGVQGSTEVADYITLSTVWTARLRLRDARDAWRVASLTVASGETAASFEGADIVGSGFLEAPFTFSVKTTNEGGAGTPATVYATLVDTRGTKRSFAIAQGVADRSLVTIQLAGLHMDDIVRVELGHYSKDNWYVDHVQVTKRGETRTFSYGNTKVNKFNRPVGRDYLP